ncbi:MAG: hypothetical protein LBP59_18600 [Planctomycetaceae bacterium]|jgi:hypothetical protein|nr:hypothetical protein [Planctomycetaceae bacterium]
MQRRTLHKTIWRITIFLSLFVYVYALILLPVLHSHHDNSHTGCNETHLHSDLFSCLYSHGDSDYQICINSDQDQNCAICKILCTTVPMFVSGGVTIIVTDVLFELSLISNVHESQHVCTMYFSRAPPVAV